MGKSHIYPWRKKKISSCTFVYLYVCLSENQTKRQMLSLLTRPFFFASYRKLVWWMGGFSGALNSANRYLMYDIKLIYENKTGVHTYFFSGLNICDCFWFCFVSFRFFFFFYPLSFLFLFTWIVVENFLLKREWNKQLHLFHIDG